MRRALYSLLVIGIASGVGAMSARADGTYHSHHYALAPLNGAPLRSGFVENIHPNGPNVYAHEQYAVNGARPNTTYQVVLMIFPGDLTCSSTPLLTMTTAVFTTNAAGNGTAEHVFTPADADGLRGLTVGARWSLLNGSTAEYATACATVHLD